MYAIYELTPAPWGDSYRFVQGFDARQDAEDVLTILEKVNKDFSSYKIINWTKPKENNEKVNFS